MPDGGPSAVAVDTEHYLIEAANLKAARSQRR